MSRCLAEPTVSEPDALVVFTFFPYPAYTKESKLMSKHEEPLTRRRFLEWVGAVGGAAAVYETMVAMGMLALPEAFAGPPDTSGNRGAGRSVAVLGAGIAGLTAALRLQQAGFLVTVYEASDRIGGRNFTVSTANDARNVIRQMKRADQVCKFEGNPETQYFEAGCGRIPHHHAALLELCRELNVALQPYIMETRSNRFQTKNAFDGRPVANRQIANDTRGYIAELLAKAVNRNCLDDVLEPAERVALLSLLEAFGKVSKEDAYVYKGSSRCGFIEEPGVTRPGKVMPALHRDQLLKSKFWEHRFYHAEDYLWQTTLFHPVGGMRKIVDALRTRTGPIVKNNMVAKRIFNRESGVEVKFANQTSITADFCISTIPLPLLKGLLDPSTFNQDYRKAVEAVGFAKTCKIGWQATERFWEKLRSANDSNGQQIFGGISWIDHPITQIWYPSENYFAPGPAVLTGAYNYDSKDNPVATNFGKLDLQHRLELGLAGGAQLHPEFRNYVSATKGLSIAWQEVPHIGGGWAEWNRDDRGHAVAYRRLLDSDKRFIVAGDQVSYLPGWMEGAVLSAYHVVNLVMSGKIPHKGETLENSGALKAGEFGAPHSASITGAD